ncbi:choice-of-anchor P family protein [Actinophytocola oryzae]|uniref:LPXTG-motif cell wall-anchored protein n=1 Tax=Actinophytocola oryzae TaxID=502181 RepID=A0A4R7VR42_9PSEU|nr:choice-of-anchor P family protein [Actinophytocola oryzae]TDV52236.1 hypothetical protein CLV71_105368 [Actinophytocola oryzae]
MRERIVRRGAVAGVVVAASLVFGAMPASADPGDGSAYVAMVAVTMRGEHAVDTGVLAPSSTAGPNTADVASVEAAKLVTAGTSSSSANLDQETGLVSSAADVSDVGLGLASLNGRIGAVKGHCEGDQGGVKGATTLSDVQIPGANVPANPEPNTAVDTLAARLVFNEQVRADDGSLTVNALHVYMNPTAGSGDVVLAQAKCGPPSPPVPLASGLGLWLSVGLLGLAAIPGGLAIRRRRTEFA